MPERHVLFIDDDENLRNMMTAMLEQAGVGVTVAKDGQEGYEIMQNGLNPDVILCDVEMPRMDGFTFLETLRHNDDWLKIPVILMTGHNAKTIMRRGMMLGADDLLIKPLDPERLVLSIYNRAKRTQELTRFARSEHEKLEYIKRDMARMFTHELSTPLVSLNIVTELLSRHADKLSTEQATETIESLQSGMTRLNRLMGQMVLLVQLDTGERFKLIEEARRSSPLWDVLTAAVSLARAFSYRQRDVPIHYDAGMVTGEVLVHMESLRHAMAEILSNAMAFSPKDNGAVTIKQWADAGQVHLSITDEGPGIAAENMGEIARRFSQFEREKHDQQGIGMGLYIARTIVEAHDGSLEIESALGEGTTVTLSLPLINADTGALPDDPLAARLAQP